MHRDKTVARILLILSVVHVAVAAPLITERSQGLNEDVTPTSENGINLVGDSPQDLSSVPHMNNEPPTSGTPPSQDHSLPESGTPQLYHDQSLASGPPPSQDATSPASGDSQSHSGPPAGSNDPQLHNTDLSPTGDMVLAKSSAPPPPPKANGLFTDAMKKKLKVVAGFGVLAGFTGGLIYGAHKLIKDPSQEVQPAGRGLTSSDVVGRAESTHPQPSKNPVSRALANLRNQDLGLLRILTGRALERLD